MDRRFRRAWIAVPVLAISGLVGGVVASAAITPAAGVTATLQGGEQLGVACAGAKLTFTRTDGLHGLASCTPAATTTTTVAPPTTVPDTTTVPVTTTTQPPETTTTVPTTGGSVECPQFQTAPSAAFAFCEPFDQPAPVAGTRSGDLDGVLWGVSHATSASNTGQQESYNWAASTQDQCGTTSQVAPEHDVTVCDGRMVESSNDSTGQTVLGAYPRQPFDFAGRTGTVEFDVSDNTEGPHSAWPAFVITDQPVPAPYDLLSGISDNARASIGVSFAQTNCDPSTCGHGSSQDTCVGVDTIWTTSGYQPTDQNVTADGCVTPATGPSQLNHVEVQVSATGIRVYMADAGDPSSLRQVAHSNFTAPLTRGVVWLEDVHYNGNKFNTQQTNTFAWDNLAFDGPTLPRDLGFDVADNTQRGGAADNGLPMTDLGYIVPNAGRTVTVTVPGVTNVDQAAAVLLELTYWPETEQTLTVTVNGNPSVSMPWPFGNDPLFTSQTVAIPIPAADVHDGANTVTVGTSDTGNGVAVGNFDLILAGAGGTVAP